MGKSAQTITARKLVNNEESNKIITNIRDGKVRSTCCVGNLQSFIATKLGFRNYLTPEVMNAGARKKKFQGVKDISTYLRVIRDWNTVK
jgi:hypothetical protein